MPRRNRPHLFTLLSLSSLLIPFSSPHAAMNASNTLTIQTGGIDRMRITQGVSLTTGATTWDYMGSNATYLPNLASNAISTTNISVTTLNGINISTSEGSTSSSMMANFPDALLCSGATGTVIVYLSESAAATGVRRYDYTQSALYTQSFNANGSYNTSESDSTSWTTSCENRSISQLYAEGKAFNLAGGGISLGGTPSGQISAFDLATCPTGWSEYTPARGRFLRGIDNGAGNDPSGTRVAGAVQDMDTRFYKSTYEGSNQPGTYRGGPYDGDHWNRSTNSASYTMQRVYQDWDTTRETRPKNVAVLYCRKN